MAEVTFGLDRNNKSIKHISEVIRGLRCDCICIQCGKELKAAKGDIQEHHFKHHEQSDCKASFESVLHLTAKNIIRKGNSFHTGEKGIFQYFSTELERVCGGYRYDAYISTSDKPIAIEIIVTSHVSTLKRDYIRLTQQRAIQINLQSVDRNVNYEELERLVLVESSSKRTIWWESEPQLEQPISKTPIFNYSYYLCLTLLLLLIKPVREFIFRLFK